MACYDYLPVSCVEVQRIIGAAVPIMTLIMWCPAMWAPAGCQAAALIQKSDPSPCRSFNGLPPGITPAGCFGNAVGGISVTAPLLDKGDGTHECACSQQCSSRYQAAAGQLSLRCCQCSQ